MDDRIKRFLSSKDNEIFLLYGIKKSGKSNYVKAALKGRKEKILYYEFKNTNLRENTVLLKNRISLLLGIKTEETELYKIFEVLSEMKERAIIIIEKADLLFKFASFAILPTLKKTAEKHSIILTTDEEELYEWAEKEEGFDAEIKEVAKYYESFEHLRSLPEQKQLSFFLTFGSSEFAISKIDTEESLKRNVRNILLDKESILREYIEHELFEDLGKKSYAFLILSILKDDRMKYGELVEKTGQKYNGLLDKQLNILSSLGLVKKSYPINKKLDRKKVLYEINDNLLRFYFRFIYPEKELIEIMGSKAYYEKYIEKELDDYFKKSMRSIVSDYLEKLAKNGKFGSIALIGRYFISDENEEEFAIITENTERIFSIFYNMRVDDEMLLKEKKRIKEITKGKAELGLVSTNGFTFPSDGEVFISLKDIFSLKS